MPRDARGNAAKRVVDASPGPWRRWRTESRHSRAIRFMETYCRPPKGTGHGHPLRLAEFQKEFLEEALADHVDVAIIATGRGNGKSTLGGALATWALFDDEATGAPQVPVIATTIQQAVRSIYGVAVSMIKHEPELLRRSLVFTGIATNVCVESTLRDSFFLEYFSVVLHDATHHAGPDFIQQASLYNIEKFFGWVSSTDEFRAALQANINPMLQTKGEP